MAVVDGPLESTDGLDGEVGVRVNVLLPQDVPVAGVLLAQLSLQHLVLLRSTPQQEQQLHNKALYHKSAHPLHIIKFI